MRRKQMTPEMVNALQIGTDSEGGYLVPDEYEKTLVEALEEENINIDYEMSVNEENFEKIIAEGRNKDIKFGMTSYGPHRDDIIFDIDGIDVRKYGSQGQKRTTALSLKLAEIELVKQKIGEMPILLLDDVLSELDSKRQNYLLNSLNGVQTIITCTGLDEFIDNRFEINKIYKVVKGKVCPYIAK